MHNYTKIQTKNVRARHSFKTDYLCYAIKNKGAAAKI